MINTADAEMWWDADDANVGARVIEQVRRIEMNQSDLFVRFQRLEVLYDPNTPAVSEEDVPRGNMQENIIASNVDTLYATIATQDVRPRVMTDGGDWEQQRTARDLELYAEEQNKLLDVLPHCRDAFKEAEKKGNGLVKVVERFKEPVVEPALVENIVVDENETRDYRTPTHMHEWVSVDADKLIAEFPKKKADILKARGQRTTWRTTTRFFPVVHNEIVYLDSYRLPIGTKGERGYKPGRHTRTLITGVVLDDVEYDDDFFPYGVIMFSKRAKSWYAISAAERVAGIQRALNKRNWQIEKANDNVALPITMTRPVDSNAKITTSRMGTQVTIKGDWPQTFTPTAVNAETYADRRDLRDSGNREFGQSQMATHGTKPAGLDSGVALREFKDQTSDRYSPQEKAFDQLVLDVTWLVLQVCKKLGKAAPKVVRVTRFGKRTIRWADVDLGELRWQLQPASNLPRTPAGREQFVLELAQAGVISKDSVPRLLQHPDLEGELSLYTAALEACEEAFDEIARGNAVAVEPFMNFDMCAWRGQMEYLKWWTQKAPEDRLELLRQFVVTAAWLKSGGMNAQATNVNAGAPGAMSGAAPPGGPGPMPPGPGAMPPLPGGPPANGPVAAALSPQAMQLVAAP